MSNTLDIEQVNQLIRNLAKRSESKQLRTMLRMVSRMESKKLAKRAGVVLLALQVAVFAAGDVNQLTSAEREAVESAAQRTAVAEHVEAINAVEAVIESIERRSSRYNPALSQPLVVLGDALAGVGDTVGAFRAYRRALHVTRVHYGLHHPGQVPIVYREAHLLAEIGNRKKANSRHEYAYGILLRRYGGNHPGLLPGMFALADWYMSSYDIFSARALYGHAATLAKTHLGGDYSAQVRALRSFAATYRDERFPPFYTRRREESNIASSFAGFQYRGVNTTSANRFANGERALIEVVNIVQGRRDADNEEVAKAMLELGDWFTMFEKHRRATSLYHRVWEMLQDNPSLLERTFKAPTPLYMPLPKVAEKIDGVRGETARNGVVELSIAVDERGLVSRIDTLRSEPKDLMDFKVRRAVKRARYRPAFNGEMPLATDGVRVMHTFVYYPSAQASTTRGEAAIASRG